MDDIRQERSNDGQTLKLNKNLNKRHLTKNLEYTSRNLWPFSPSKNKQYSIPRSKVISTKPLSGRRN